MKTLWPVILLVISFFLGCLMCGCGPTSMTLDEADLYYKRYLPTGAEEVIFLGNGWISFELAIAGKKRKFLYKSHALYADSATECVTELRD